MSSLCENTDFEKSITEELIPKKVRFRGGDVDSNNNMLIDSSPKKPISWRDMLVGQSSKDTLIDLEGKKDQDILDGDIQKNICEWRTLHEIDLYNHKIITEIGEMVGKVVKLDMSTDNRTRGRFVRLAVYVDLEKPLVSHILINGRKKNVEYESLSTIYFHCGRYGHVENSCSFKNSEIPSEKENAPSKMSSEIQNTIKASVEKEYGNFGPWIIVEKKSRRKIRENVQNSLNNQ
ncbi:hypothetical protein Godav_025947 [Gossypium davidsonii]|uniref:CCHC-type domain-containing protein n=2 Tax=Gossypium TaxID=3633 RepID=A0A7J8TDC2_GOSDV|nr:hypothetical protein [Gossypium davidsonii]MBA0656260.1 hypothetical protein [Gossypium klotzschianum]